MGIKMTSNVMVAINYLWLIVLVYGIWLYYHKVRLHVSYLQKLKKWKEKQPKTEEPEPEKKDTDPWANAHELFGDPSMSMPAWLLLIYYETNDPELEGLRKRINRMTLQLYILFFLLFLI